MEREITKVVLLKEVCNDMCHNWYFLCYGKLYNNDKTKYKSCKFVICIDSDDLWEYYEGKEHYTDRQVREYVKFLACENLWAMAQDYNRLSDFYDWCNETIENYNRTCKL